MSARRSRLIGLGVILAVVVFLVVRLTAGGTRDALADVFEDPAETCASVSNEDWAPNRFYLVPTGFARAAVERAAIICNNLGPSTYYFRFTDRRALVAALRMYPSMLSHRLCTLDHEVFTGDDFDAGSPPTESFTKVCARLHGRILLTVTPAR